MSVTQGVDLVYNGLGLVLLFLLSVIAIVRWIQRGRIESYSSNELMPNWLPRWMGAVFGVCSPDDSRARRSTVSGVTVWGWLFVGCIAIWLFTKAR